MGTFSITQIRASADLFLSPSANGCNIELTPVGATNNWECVDDDRTTPDDDTTYVKNSSPSLKYDLYVLPNHTTETGTINYVQVFTRAKSHEFAQHEDGIYKILISDNACANIYKSNDINLTASSYSLYNETWTINPRTSVAWTWDNIDNLQIGNECNSPTLIGQEDTMTLYPNGDGGQCGSIRLDCKGICNPVNNWALQSTLDDYVFINASSHALDTWYCDHYTMQNHTALGTESINYVYVRIFAGRSGGASPEFKARTLLVSGGNDYYGDEVVLSATPAYIATQYVVNPDTSVAWTWANIDAIMCGSSLKIDEAGYDAECYITELIVNYNIDINPEIRTTQCYAKVNYIPSDSVCTLNKPEKISINHSMNIKMLNFWNGTREVYSLNRNGKSIVLTGSEYQSNACEHIACMREMGKDGSTIAISGLRNLFNGNYEIRSFGWKHINNKPENYTWILELEYTD